MDWLVDIGLENSGPLNIGVVYTQEQEPRWSSSGIPLQPMLPHVSHPARSVRSREHDSQKRESINWFQMQILPRKVWLKKRKTRALFNTPGGKVQVFLPFLRKENSHWDQAELARDGMLWNQNGENPYWEPNNGQVRRLQETKVKNSSTRSFGVTPHLVH